MEQNKQRTISFRLNMEKEDERELYESIKGHDCYGSSGAYIKAALKYFCSKEKEYELQERLQSFFEGQMERMLTEQTKAFVDALAEHDQKLLSMALTGVSIATPVMAVKEPTVKAEVPNQSIVVEPQMPDASEDIPAEALAYLGL